MDQTSWSKRRELLLLLSSQGLGGVFAGFEMRGKVLG